MSRKILTLCFCTIFLCSFTNYLFAQKRKKKDPLADVKVYLYKADWSGVADLDQAIYFMQVIKQNDSSYICRYYQKFGPMVKQQSYKDADLTIANGRFCWYNNKGMLDSTGWVTNKRKDGYWDYYENGKLTLTIKFHNGRLINKTDYINKIFFDESNNQISLEEKHKTDSIQLDSFKTTQVEAKFPNDQSGWIKYLQSKLETPDRLANVLGDGVHTVVVSFMINKMGYVDDDMYLSQSVEWSGDMMALSVIQKSPQWQPAYQNGRPVIYRQRQSLSFQVNSY